MIRVLADTGDDRNVLLGIDWGGSHHQVCALVIAGRELPDKWPGPARAEG